MKTVGIVGGVGPEASNKFCEMLIKYKSKEKDQDNIPFIHYCNPKIPDRTEAILGIGEDPTEELTKSCKALQTMGADFIVIPCNSAHHFLDKIQENVDAPILDMTKALVKKVLLDNPEIKKIGVLSTTGSIKAKVFQNYFDLLNIESITPTQEDQENLVMESIYGKKGIKAGKKIFAKKTLTKAIEKLVERGAEAVVLGCTEIPLVINQKNFDIKLYDPMNIVAREIVDFIEREEKEVAIVHHDLEETEKKLAELLKDQGVKVRLVDIREAKINDFLKSDLVLNRVYASVANRDYSSIRKVLVLSKWLEKIGIKCLNSYQTSLFDYNKFEAYKIMKENDIPTPETIFIKDLEEVENSIEACIEIFPFPMVIKRNAGGRGKDISKVESKEELKKELKNKFEIAKQEKYEGGFIVQELLKPSREYDSRIGITAGDFCFSYKRSLVSLDEKEAWIASTSNGSMEDDYEASLEERELAAKASKLIGAEYNELDIYFTENGPSIIEHNPTPNYFVDDVDDLERMQKFVDFIIARLENKEEEISSKDGIQIRTSS